jgi:hypothetical protein
MGNRINELAVTHEMPKLDISRYGVDVKGPLELLRESRYSEFFDVLHDEGLVFGNNDELRIELTYGNDIEIDDKRKAAELIARRIYNSVDDKFIKKTLKYYFQNDDRSIFLIKNDQNCEAVNITLHHPDESTTEYLAGASDENFKGLGGIVIDSGRLQGILTKSLHNIARSYGDIGIRYLLKNGFKNPHFNDDIDVEFYRTTLTLLEYVADKNLSFDREFHKFYKFAPRPTRVPSKEDSISEILAGIEDWKTMFFVKEMDTHDYQKLSERLLSSLSKKESI